MNNNYLNSLNLKKFFSIIIYALVLLGIYLTSFKSYLLFHSIAEVFSIVIACGIFLLAWNTRRLIDNHYLLFLGIAYLFVGTVDFVHTLAFKGMNIFSGYDANLPTQLWIIARYLESISIFLAPIFLIKRLNPYLTFIIYLIVTSALFISIFTIPVFPDCFIEGKGLTLFKIISEYIISSILSASILVLLNPIQTKPGRLIFTNRNARMQINAISDLIEISNIFSNDIEILFKVHPGFPELELLHSAAEESKITIFPVNSGLEQILREVNVVIGINYYGSGIINTLINNLPFINYVNDELYEFSYRKMSAAPEMFDEGIFTIRSCTELKKFIRDSISNPTVLEQIILNEQKFTAKYLNNSNFPIFSAIIDNILKGY